MAVHQEMVIGGVLVLADAGLDERRSLERGETHRDVFARRGKTLGGRRALAARRVEVGTAGVVGDLEAAILVARDSVEETRDLDPDRHAVLREARVAGGSAKEEDVLARRLDRLADRVGKDAPHPWPARENVRVGLEGRAVAEKDSRQTPLLDRAGRG